MDEPLGWTHTDLDARFDTVRRAESNIGARWQLLAARRAAFLGAWLGAGIARHVQRHAPSLKRATLRSQRRIRCCVAPKQAPWLRCSAHSP